MAHHGRLSILWPICAGALLILAGSGLLALWSGAGGFVELDAARRRWAARPFSSYRLELEYGALGYCRQSVEVAGDRVVAVLRNTCSSPAPTVDELFDRIERDMATLAGRCGPNGCACDGTIEVSAAYDARLGFPYSKRVYLNPLARWRYPEYWQQRMSGELCSSRELGREIITVVALSPHS